MKTAPPVDVVNIYRHNGMWAYSAWIEGFFDHSDTLPDSDTELEARAEAEKLFPQAVVCRVSDIDH